MLSFRTIASGSSGNASCRRICQALAGQGLRPEDLSAVLITHEHTDHISGLATYIKKYRTPILSTPGTARQLHYRLAGVAPLLWSVPMEEARWGELSVRLLPTSHDCAESAAFRFDTPDGSLGYLTDTGYIDSGGPAGQRPAGAGEQPRREHAPGGALPLPPEAPGAGGPGAPEQ